MIYLDACALLKFIKSEPETGVLRAWRHALPEGTELVTSELAQLEITRTCYAPASITSGSPTSPGRR